MTETNRAEWIYQLTADELERLREIEQAAQHLYDVFHLDSNAEFASKQKQAWNRMEQALDG